MMFKPKSWNKARRYVIKRTPIVDKDDQQLYLDDGLRRYVYWIVVNNSKRSNEQVLRIAQGRGNQENLIKDFKYGLGLAHIPTGSLAANQAYFMIAALAWELEDVDVESAAPRGWRGDAFPALSVSVDLASRNGREERPQYGRAEAAGG